MIQIVFTSVYCFLASSKNASITSEQQFSSVSSMNGLKVTRLIAPIILSCLLLVFANTVLIPLGPLTPAIHNHFHRCVPDA